MQISPWRRMLKNSGMRAAGRCGYFLHALCGNFASGKLGILTYHRVAPHTPGIPAPEHNVSPARFREQLTGLLNRGLTPWPLQRVLGYRRMRRTIPANVFVVTFDDGFESVYTHAWPVLRELKIPATIFLNTAFSDSEEPFPFDDWGTAWQGKVPADHYRPLTTAQCRELLASGQIDIGAHTHTHQDFRGRPEAFRADLERNLEELQARFGISSPTFAFPFGSPHLGYAGGELERAARDCDIVCALTTRSVLVNAREDHPFSWGRMNVFPWDTSRTLSAKLAGWYSWAPQLRQRLAGFVRTGSWMCTLHAMQSSAAQFEL